MEYSRLINDYLEGELHPVLEDKLFAELALNQDLRFELNKQIKLQMLTRSDMNNITIPSESTEAIFSNLGFSIPSASSNFGSSALSRFTSSFSFNKSINYILGITSAFLIAFMLFSNFNNSNPIVDANKASFASAKPSSSPVFNKTNTPVYPVSSSRSALVKKHNSINQNLPKQAVPVSNLSLAANTEATTNNDIEPAQIANEQLPLTQSVDKFQYSNVAAITLSNHLNKSMLPNYSLNYSPAYEFSKPVGLEISWAKQNFNVSKPSNIGEDDKTFAFGSNLSILYNINQYHAIGFDFGEETFPEEFNYHNGEQPITIKQNPNYQWFAGSYRYMARDFEFLDAFTPFAKLIVGGARGGFIAKGQLGISWQFSSLISANISGEYGTLLYNVNKNLYHSDKFGIMYGFSVHF